MRAYYDPSRLWAQKADSEIVMVDTCGSEVGGSEPNREIVSFLSCVRTCGLVVRSELGEVELARPLSLFPFGSGGYFFLVLCRSSESC